MAKFTVTWWHVRRSPWWCWKVTDLASGEWTIGRERSCMGAYVAIFIHLIQAYSEA